MQDQCTNNMTAVINSLYMSVVQQVCVPFKILMWTLVACERRVNIPLDFSLTVKALPHECVSRTSRP